MKESLITRYQPISVKGAEDVYQLHFCSSDQSLIILTGDRNFINVYRVHSNEDSFEMVQLFSIPFDLPVLQITVVNEAREMLAVSFHNCKEIELWDYRTGKLMNTLQDQHTDVIISMIHNPSFDCSFVSASRNGQIVLWEFPPASCLLK